MKVSHNFTSPLRYPGGKAKLSSFIEDILLLNNLENCTFYELYAGGAGAAINILLSGLCKNIVINDYDYHIFAFWHSILNQTEDFLKLIQDTKVDIPTWEKQRLIYSLPDEFDRLSVGFSAFFLNRVNRSGILSKAGPIGGLDQTGNYKMDVRFNKEDLVNRIKNIAQHRDKIEVRREESILFLKEVFSRSEHEEKQFLFLDPPYYVQGERLYFNSYTDADHAKLSESLTEHRHQNWLLTYDNCDRINQLYAHFRRSLLPMSYTLQTKRQSKEVMIFSDSLYLPKKLKIGAKVSNFELVENPLLC